jgi:GDYXXLXY protein
MKKITIGLFIAMCLLQWLVPAKMIYDSENLLREGTQYRFRTLPIDPSDPFRGKYITLNFEATSITLTDSTDWKPGEAVFVSFTTDSAGFAQADAISRDEPSSGSYLKTTISYRTTNKPFQVFFELPFDRFYLEESKAPQVEQVYLNSQRDSTQVTYGLVSIGAGTALLKDVMINEKSIVEVVNELNEAEK